MRRARRLTGTPARTLALVLAAAGIAGSSRTAEAQFFGGMGMGGSTAGGSGAGANGLYSNPYASPAINPFLNPYAALYAPATGTNAAFFLLAANQSAGGIGSGLMSGTRSRPGAAISPPKPANRRVSDIPGGSAARYFNRTVKSTGVPQGHYNRYGNYYSLEGH